MAPPKPHGGAPPPESSGPPRCARSGEPKIDSPTKTVWIANNEQSYGFQDLAPDEPAADPCFRRLVKIAEDAADRELPAARGAPGTADELAAHPARYGRDVSAILAAQALANWAAMSRQTAAETFATIFDVRLLRLAARVDWVGGRA
jgi:hypothetical protein